MSIQDVEGISFTDDLKSQIKSYLFNTPRELSGFIINAIEGVLDKFEGENSALFIDGWKMPKSRE